MTDRSVRQVAPQPSQEEAQPRPFSTFLDRPNIVLLGNPGAGKSHLFDHFAAQAQVRPHKARSFLNAASINPSLPLFIDALDEKRAGRGDTTTVDAIVAKLNQWQPVQVRIACRAADWLGESDLAAFRDYFDEHGGYVVVALEKLTRDEQRAVLASVRRENPDAFLDEAAARGLQDLTDNPQNLRMLHEAVKSGTWPATRRELYQISADLLLTEHNKEHARRGAGTYAPTELRLPAGALFAARLISDVDGISLTDTPISPDFPSYRTSPVTDLEEARAVLSRPIFASAALTETVDYTHRTVAEYLAAAWLAHQIRSGLPLGRVLALIGIEGHPASELRGLHAWLPIFLPEHAPAFIEADPFGVLTYADAASLSPQNRQYIVSALARLSEQNPWFRGGDWEPTRIGALSGPDMLEAFRTILSSDTANFALRSIVLDALVAGQPNPALEPELLATLANAQVPYASRLSAVQALLRLPTGRQSVFDAYRDQLCSTEADLRLKSTIIASIYAGLFTVTDVIELLATILGSQDDLPIGTTWQIAPAIPTADLVPLLDQLQHLDPVARRGERPNHADVQHTVDTLILRAIAEQPNLASPQWVRAWLNQTWRIDERHVSDTSPLKLSLQNRPELVRSLADVEIDEFEVGSRGGWLLQSLQKVTLGLLDQDDLLDRLVDSLNRQHSPEKTASLYELALNSSFRDTPRARAACQLLWALADQRPDLLSVRERCSSWTLPDWRIEQVHARTRRQEEARETREFWTQRLRRNDAAVRAGTDLKAMGFLADLYLAHFNDVDVSLPPTARLVEFVGEEGTAATLQGLTALLQRPDLPPLGDLVTSFANNAYYRWWNAITAGVYETWNAAGSLAPVSDEALRLFAVMRLQQPPNRRQRSALAQTDDAVMQALHAERPSILRDAYLAMARADLDNNDANPTGLHELLDDAALAQFRHQIIIDFLTDYPHLVPTILSSLLRAALAIPNMAQRLLPTARRSLTDQTTAPECRLLWLAAAYLLASDEFKEQAEIAGLADPQLFWKFRDFIGHSRHHGALALQLTTAQSEHLLIIAGRHFTDMEEPTESCGIHNAWDGADFVRTLLTNLSNDTSVDASRALARLEAHPNLAGFLPHVRHARASQHARRREVLYVQPDWSSTVAALNNGRPASAPDLHALLLAHLCDARLTVAGSNEDAYRPFWNEDPHRQLIDPKPEESCRDALLRLIRDRLARLSVTVEPEGHMVADRRADLVAFIPGTKIPIEIKRDYHADVWTAAQTQLQRAYTLDPETSGYGIYLALWFGDGRPKPMPRPPGGGSRPTIWIEMEEMLRQTIPADQRTRLAVVVVDVTDPRSAHIGSPG